MFVYMHVAVYILIGHVVVDGWLKHHKKQSMKFHPLKFRLYSIANAKQKHLGCNKVQGQSEATLLTGMCDQNL